MNLNKFFSTDPATGILKTPVASIFSLKSGKEHNVIAESIQDGVLYGRAGLARHICLYEPQVGARPILLVDSRESIQRTLSAPGKERTLHYESPCYLLSDARIALDQDDVSLVEIPVAIVFSRDPHLPGGGIDEDYVTKVVPALARYRLPGGGFASNVAAAALAPFAVPVRTAHSTPGAPNAQIQAKPGLMKRVPLASAEIEEIEPPASSEA